MASHLNRVFPPTHLQEEFEENAPKRWAGFKEAVPRTGQFSVSSGCVTPRNTGKS